MMTSFAVRIAIETPISLRGLFHLDGLLGALLVARGGKVEDIPLVQHDGVWQGSAALLETGQFGAVISETVRLKHIAADGVPMGLLNHLKASQRRVTEMHPMRSALSSYQCIEGVRAVWFTAKGDVEGVVDLLRDARNLGAMGRSGWGRTVETAAFEVRDDPLSGIVLASGVPARTLPLVIWESLGRSRPEGGVVSMQRSKPPYWSGDEVRCISPTQIDLVGTLRELSELVCLI